LLTVFTLLIWNRERKGEDSVPTCYAHYGNSNEPHPGTSLWLLYKQIRRTITLMRILIKYPEVAGEEQNKTTKEKK
jgi:hypothetical protein